MLQLDKWYVTEHLLVLAQLHPAYVAYKTCSGLNDMYVHN